MTTPSPLTEGPVSRQLFRFALPLLLSNFFQQLYNTIDAAIVGTFVGDSALAAIGSAGQLTVFLIYFFLGLSTGASIRISLSYGEQQYERMERETHTAIVLGVLSGAALTGLGLLFAPNLLRLMNLEGESLDNAVQYIRCYFLSMIPMMLYNMGSGILRAVGDSKTPLCCLLLSGGVNVVLDLLFVVVFDWKVAGAALATVLAQTISAVFLLEQLRRAEGPWQIELCRLRMDRSSLGHIVHIGVPTGVQSVLVTFSNVIVQSQVNRFGLDVMAGVTSYLKIEGILYMPIDAMSLSISNFIGQNLGAGRKEAVKSAMRTGMLLILALTLALEAVLLLTGRSILRLFSQEEEVLSYSLAMLHTLVPLYFVYAVNQTLVGGIRGMGNALSPMLITLLSMCCLRIVWIVAGLQVYNHVQVIFVSYPLTWLVTMFSLSICYRRTRHQLLCQG